MPQSGRTLKLGEREKRYVIQSVKKDFKITALKIAKDVKINLKKKTVYSDTIRKILKKNGGHGRVARRKPAIRLAF